MRIADAEPDENGNSRIRVQVQLPGWSDFVDVWPSPFPMPNMVQAVAANGGRVGFFHVAGFEGDQQPIASFKYLKLENVRLVPRGDVDAVAPTTRANGLCPKWSTG